MPPFAATHCLCPCPFDFSPPPQLFLSNCLVQLLLFLSDPLSFLFFSLHSSFLSFLPSLLSQCFVVFLLCLAFSLRKQPTFGDATTGFPAKWRLRNERRKPILRRKGEQISVPLKMKMSPRILAKGTNCPPVIKSWLKPCYLYR